jgi:uncharacterized protein involved in outer membrane biogenesis
LLKAALSLVGLAVAGILGVFVFLDAIIGKGIEAGCTQALGVDTSVGLVRVGLLTGTFSIRRLRIDNPPGFEADHFISFDRVHFDVPRDSLKEDTIVVPLLEIDGIDVSLETVDGKTNYDVILANLKRFSSSGSADPGGEPPDAEDEGSGKELVIREAVIRDITARIDLGKVGSKANRVEVEIPEMRLHPNKETGSAEASVAQVTEVIVTAVLIGIAKKAPAELAKGLFKGLGGLKTVTLEMPGALLTGAGSVGGAAAKLGEDAGGAVKKLGDSAGSAIKSLGGLFGGSDEEQ